MKSRVCIIGGGVIGCATAFELAQAGHAVRLIERGNLGAESSWAGAGLLTPLLPWQYAQAVSRLIDWSLDLYPNWIAQLQSASGVDPEYRVSGMLVLPPYDLTQAQGWAQVRGGGEALCEINAHQVAPQLTYDGPALWMPKVAQVRNPRLIQALRAALLKLDVLIQEQTPVVSWQTEAGKVCGVQTAKALFHADTYIVTSGSWTPAVLGDQGKTLPIRPMRGQIVLYRAEPGRLKQVLYKDGIYIIPRVDGHILVGSTLEDVGFDKSVTNEARSLLTQQAETLLPWLADASIVGHWSGLRPGSPDNIPLIGPHPDFENLYINAGHYRYGVTMAPASATLLANQLLGKPNPIETLDYAVKV